ncbi:hypothetical protein PHYPSEUDO_006485 [Phytophthora pseudosyringae]|uniref:Uncharacterized protein n=1 Tax=Phytophthora pseudosyringae TaxID=221518 RepID=A0A8T1VIZ6_9STRA|nr:hypothetical protein PHYPSEUDO_006485 [Phytophthora pseudosyringae]
MDTSHIYYPPSSCVPTAPSRMGHKQSARAQARARANRRHVNLVAMPLSPRQQTEEKSRRHSVGSSMETFRSPRVLEEVVQVEMKHQTVLPQPRPPMTPEEAFDKLRQAVSVERHRGKDPIFNAPGAREVLAGLEAACWQPFTPDHDSSSDGCSRKRSNGVTTDEGGQVNQRTRILYSQLLRGTDEILRGEESVCQELRDQIRQVEERNSELPKMIQECQAAVTRAMESAVHGAVSFERRLSHANITDGADVAATTATIREEVAETRRRKGLRSWACNDLRAGLNDLITRRSELKQLVSVAIGDVKREEQANKLRAKRLEDLRTVSTATSLLPTGRVGSKTSTQQLLARLTLALAKNQVLQEARRDHKAFVRARTEAIFDVRNQLRELNNQRVTVETDLKGLEEEAAHMKRAFTPRPDWNELRDATVVTTAVDRVDASARMRMGATRNKLSGTKGADIDEDRASEQRIMQVLSSSWSTVAKIGAMAAELAKIRSRDHAGDTILAEQKKLKHLHKEIARLMQQLEAVKAQSAA